MLHGVTLTLAFRQAFSLYSLENKGMMEAIRMTVRLLQATRQALEAKMEKKVDH
jgi:hypothetical protein